jgi:hypothetical protein
MSRKKFFYLSTVSFLLLGVMISGLITAFLGIDHMSTLLLVGLIWALFGVPAVIAFVLALFAHSAEPFVGRETSFSSAFIAALGLIGLIALIAHFIFLFS